MLKFGSKVTHVLDCPESNKEEYSRVKAFSHSEQVKQICPLLLPVSEKDLEDHNRPARVELEAALKKEFHDIRMIHSQLGLTYDFYPKEKAFFDTEKVIKLDE